MSVTKIIDPETWTEFLSEFSTRNSGRRARFELFSRGGNVGEEEQEGHFQSASINGSTVTIKRTYKKLDEDREMSDDIPNIHGVAVQLDSDSSENTLELTNLNGDMTVLHFESKVDGDS